MEQKLPLLPYQKRVGQLLHQEKNVILQAPTGAGKTYAAIRPFIYGLEKGRDFPQKCIYAVPMRVLANQFVEGYQGVITEQATQRKLIKQRGWNAPYVDIQTGEQRSDPSFEAVLTFATIDQVLSSFLVAPYGLSPRKGNLNAGAVAASYLVFDEFHLFDPESTLPTTLEMLHMLRAVAPFLLMTATFSRTMLHMLAEWLGAEVVGGTDEELAEFAALPSQQKTRRYHTVESAMTAQQVLNAHKTRSIVVCNQVERAQALFQAIRAQASDEIEVLLLHSRFLGVDRNRIETRIRTAFGKDSDKSGSLIVVSTQAIEVGLDINCNVLHTELAPANAIIQRAGRCARYEGTQGDVFIYRCATKNDGSLLDLTIDVMPYPDQQDAIALTWEAFVDNQGVLDYAGEQRVLNHAHRAQDERLCRDLRSGRSEHRRQMFSVMAGEREQASRLVRDIYQQRVIIHDDPDKLLETLSQNRRSPYSLEGFSLRPGTLQGYAKDWLLERVLDDESPFRVKWLSAKSDPDSAQKNRTDFQFVAAPDPKDLRGAALIVVHPALASYDPVLGFLPRESSYDAHSALLADAAKKTGEEADDGYGYQLETYEQHIALVYEEFQRVTWPELARAAHRLEQRLGWSPDTIYHAAKLVILLHDLGKLNVEWQKYVRDWEKSIGLGHKLTAGEAYAHTDNHTSEHREKERHFRRRPWHAVEGAIAATLILADQFPSRPELVKAAFTAIARHHAAQTNEAKGVFQLESDALTRTQRTLQRHVPELKLKKLSLPDRAQQRDITPADGLIQPTSNDEDGFLVYTLLVRALRRADQRGTQIGMQEKE